MRARELPNGHLLVPRRAESDDGTIGDEMVEIDETDPHFQVWRADIERAEAHDADQPSPRRRRASATQPPMR